MDQLVQVTTACFCLFGMELTSDKAGYARPAGARYGCGPTLRSTQRVAFQPNGLAGWRLRLCQLRSAI